MAEFYGFLLAAWAFSLGHPLVLAVGGLIYLWLVGAWLYHELDWVHPLQALLWPLMPVIVLLLWLDGVWFNVQWWWKNRQRKAKGKTAN